MSKKLITFLIVALGLIFPLSLSPQIYISTRSVLASPFEQTDSIPDFINLETETVPNILLVNITTQTDSNSYVDGTITIFNPLNSLYLPYTILQPSPGLMIPKSKIGSLWEGIHLIPPRTELTYTVRFSSTNEKVEIVSDLLSSNAIGLNIFIQVLENLVPAIASISKSDLVIVIADVASRSPGILEAVTACAQISDPAMISNIKDLWDCLKPILNNEAGREFINLILSEVKLPPVSSLLFIKDTNLVKSLSVLTDLAFYVGLGAASPNKFHNHYLLHPLTLDPTKLPPWTPQLTSPLGTDIPLKPHFEWHAVPDVLSYQLELDDSADFSSLIEGFPIPTSSTSFDLLSSLKPNTTYHWRVKAISAAGKSSWSVGSFVTASRELADSSLLGTWYEFDPNTTSSEDFDWCCLNLNSDGTFNWGRPLWGVSGTFEVLDNTRLAVKYSGAKEGFQGAEGIDEQVLWKFEINDEVLIITTKDEIIHFRHHKAPECLEYNEKTQVIKRASQFSRPLWVIDPLFRGEDVRIVHIRLIQLGYCIANIDNPFDRQTEQAITEFQIDQKLPATGAIDETTWNYLFSGVTGVTSEPTLRVNGRAQINLESTHGTLNVRNVPGTGNKVIAQLPYGTIVILLEGPQTIGAYTWWKVQSDDGVQGWVVKSADGIQTLVPVST